MSFIREILEKMYQTAVQDADGVRGGRKGYRMRYDEVPEAFEREIEQLIDSRCAQLLDRLGDHRYVGEYGDEVLDMGILDIERDKIKGNK